MIRLCEAAPKVMASSFAVEVLLETYIGTRDVLNTAKGLRPIDGIAVFRL